MIDRICKFLWLILAIAPSTLCCNAADDGMALIVRTLATVDDAQVQARMLRGMNAGLAGRNDVTPPKSWHQLNARLKKSQDPTVQKELAKLNRMFGDEAATREALATVKNSKASVDSRREALRGLAAMEAEELLPILPSLLSGPLQADAIRAYAAYDVREAPRVLIGKFATFDANAQRAVLETLATRRSYASAAMAAIKDGRIPRKTVPAYVARTMRGILGQRFTDVYGEIRELGDDKSAIIAGYKKKINSPAFSTANASRGRAVYQQVCGSCHKMYGVGGINGPDLTGSNRADLDYLLLNVVDPNFDVPDSYKMVTITTKKGQVMVGNVVNENAATLELKAIGQTQTVAVAKSEVKSRVVADVSLMPEGLLKSLNDKQILDLVKYLQTNKQVELPQ